MYTYKKFPHSQSNLWIVYKDHHPYKTFATEQECIDFINQ
jgi:hypothetical protein